MTCRQGEANWVRAHSARTFACTNGLLGLASACADEDVTSVFPFLPLTPRLKQGDRDRVKQSLASFARDSVTAGPSGVPYLFLHFPEGDTLNRDTLASSLEFAKREVRIEVRPPRAAGYAGVLILFLPLDVLCCVYGTVGGCVTPRWVLHGAVGVLY